MIIDKDMWLKQMAAKTARGSKLDQFRHLDTIADLTESEMLNSLEREFFMNRKQSQELLNEWKDLNA